MDVLTLLDLLIDELNRAAQVPLSGGRAMVDREKMIETVEQIKTALPEDITQAQQIKRDREGIITEANREAEQLVSEAQEQACQLLSEHEIVRQANAEARAIVTHAQEHSAKIRRAANDYAEELLASMDNILSSHVELLNRNRESLRKMIK